MQIKICGLRYIANIKDILQLSPQYIGFIFYAPSKRFAGNNLELAAYTRTITTTKKVGVFVNTPDNEIMRTVKNYSLDIVQLHGNESPNFCKNINDKISVIKAFGINALFNFEVLKNYADACTYFLFDTPSINYGGTGKIFNWNLLNKYNQQKEFFLSGGLDIDNIQEAKKINHSSLLALDVNSKFEISYGLKDINKIKLLLHEIRN